VNDINDAGGVAGSLFIGGALVADLPALSDRSTRVSDPKGAQSGAHRIARAETLRKR
jgi:hypothetical protein